MDILHTVSRTFKFCAAHRLLNHPGRCRHLHGHNYLATVIVQGDMVQATGMVLDFAWLKEKIGLWIDDNWDHNILLNRDDPLFKFGLFDSGSSGTLRKEFFRGKEPFATDQDPTAEVLAAILVQKTNTVLPLGCKLRGVTVRETEDCSAGCEVTYEETT